MKRCGRWCYRTAAGSAGPGHSVTPAPLPLPPPPSSAPSVASSRATIGLQPGAPRSPAEPPGAQRPPAARRSSPFEPDWSRFGLVKFVKKERKSVEDARVTNAGRRQPPQQPPRPRPHAGFKPPLRRMWTSSQDLRIMKNPRSKLSSFPNKSSNDYYQLNQA